MIKAALSLLVLGLALQAHAGTSALGGTYKVLKGCGDFSLLPDADNVLVQADEQGLRLGQVFWTGNGGSDSQPYFQAIFDYKVGVVKETCMGSCYSILTGTYSANGNEFKDVRQMFNVLRTPQNFAGETDFKLTGDTLEVNTTDNGQFTPGPLITCVLQKTN